MIGGIKIQNLFGTILFTLITLIISSYTLQYKPKGLLSNDTIYKNKVSKIVSDILLILPFILFPFVFLQEVQDYITYIISIIPILQSIVSWDYFGRNGEVVERNIFIVTFIVLSFLSIALKNNNYDNLHIEYIVTYLKNKNIIM